MFTPWSLHPDMIIALERRGEETTRSQGENYTLMLPTRAGSDKSD
jgi:hypothetical protein